MPVSETRSKYKKKKKDCKSIIGNRKKGSLFSGNEKVENRPK